MQSASTSVVHSIDDQKKQEAHQITGFRRNASSQLENRLNALSSDHASNRDRIIQPYPLSTCFTQLLFSTHILQPVKTSQVTPYPEHLRIMLFSKTLPINVAFGRLHYR